MNNSEISQIMFPCFLLVLGIPELLVGIRGRTGGKPFLVSSRESFFSDLFFAAWLLILLVTCPFEIKSITGAVVWGIFALLILAGMVGVMLRPYMKLEYRAFGFADESLLRKTLLSSLTSLGIPYEKTSSGVRLPASEIDLVIDDKRRGFRSGGFHMMKQWKFDRSLRRVLDDLVRNMNQRLRDSPNITFNSTACRKHLAENTLIIIIAGAMALYLVLR